MDSEILDVLEGVDIIKLKYWLEKINEDPMHYKDQCPFYGCWIGGLNDDDDVCGISIREIKAFYVSKNHYFCKVCYELIRSNHNIVSGLNIDDKGKPYRSSRNCPCNNFRNVDVLIEKINEVFVQYRNLSDDKISEFMIELKKYRGN
jgi:hypothetical protein